MKISLETYICLQNVSKTYQKTTQDDLENSQLDDRTVVLDIDEVKIPINQFVVIVGYSGAGKSTLMNIIGLLDLPDAMPVE